MTQPVNKESGGRWVTLGGKDKNNILSHAADHTARPQSSTAWSWFQRLCLSVAAGQSGWLMSYSFTASVQPSHCAAPQNCFKSISKDEVGRVEKSLTELLEPAHRSIGGWSTLRCLAFASAAVTLAPTARAAEGQIRKRSHAVFITSARLTGFITSLQSGTSGRETRAAQLVSEPVRRRHKVLHPTALVKLYNFFSARFHSFKTLLNVVGCVSSYLIIWGHTGIFLKCKLAVQFGPNTLYNVRRTHKKNKLMKLK